MKTTASSEQAGTKKRDAAPWHGAALVLVATALIAGAAEKTEKVVIRGSNTFGEELGPALIAEYQKIKPGVIFDLEAKATGYGLAALRAGMCDIAAASRVPIAAEQELARAAGVEFNEYVIGAYTVAVIVNATNPVSILSREQVRDIFAGVVQDWKDVGGREAPIHLYIRDPISGTHLGFQDLALEKRSYAIYARALTNYESIVNAVAGDVNGIGYSSPNLASNEKVKTVQIGGASPTLAEVHSGRYPYVRMLRLYTNKAKESQAARDFIQFILSARGQEIVAQKGFTPLP